MYKSRLIDQRIKSMIKEPVAILIKGPKWCGKSTTGLHFSKSYINLQDPEQKDAYKIAFHGTGWKDIFKLPKPILIDEWQEIKEVWNIIKWNVSQLGYHTCEYLLTGSITPKDMKGLDSGAGRYVTFIMNTMTLYELGASSGEISLKQLVDKLPKEFPVYKKKTNEKIPFLICSGGWPMIVNIKDEKNKLKVVSDYINHICSKEVIRYFKLGLKEELALAILKEYARLVATPNNKEDSSSGKYTNIVNELKNKYPTLTRQTVSKYINVFKRLYVINELEAWNANIRSRGYLKLSNKKYFCDPSIAPALLNKKPGDLMWDPETLGLFFENLVLRDLKVYMEYHDGSINYYSDRFSYESDFVLNFSGDSYALVEVKYSSSEEQIKQAVKSLSSIYDAIKAKQEKSNNKRKYRLPRALIIITSHGFPYRYKEKKEYPIYVIPITFLKP